MDEPQKHYANLKNPNAKTLYSLRFCLQEMFRKGNLWGQKVDQQLPGAGFGQ